MLCSSFVTARLTPSFFIVDFDGTCTSSETIDLLPHLASKLGPPDRAATKLDCFQKFTNEYLEGIESILKSQNLEEYSSNTLDLGGLSSCLQQMDDHSSAVTFRVSESRCLSDIQPQALNRALAEWRSNPSEAPIVLPALRPGCVGTLSSLASRGCALGVLSINWSPALIRAFLDEELHHGYELWCNELQEDGRVQLLIPGAAEKRDIIAQLVKRATGSGPVIYVGDSATDLLALLEANVGILIGESRTARRLAAKFGVPIRPLPSSLSECDVDVAQRTVFEAASWDDIRRCVDG